MPEGRILNAAVSQGPSEKYYVSLCCTDVDIKPFEKTENKIGIDLGVKEFWITSDGKMLHNPKYLKNSLDQLAKFKRGCPEKQKADLIGIKQESKPQDFRNI